MKPLITTFSFFSLASLGLAGNFITLDGASGSQSHVSQINTDNNLTIDLGFKVEYLIVGGGGGGGGSINDANVGGGGGGGAGGLISGDAFLFASAFDVEVGAGGAVGLNAATASVLQQGGNGGVSRLAGLVALGGGGGGRFKAVGNIGGSGGGGGGRGTGNNLTTAGGLGTEFQGNAGGSSRDDDSTGRAAGGGGGGAGGIGGNGGIDVSIGGNGGSGLVNWITGSAVGYAGGGGGGAADIWETGGAAGAGGAGGGAAGSVSGNARWGVNGLGGGGGGSGLNGDGGKGGSGVVIVRYKGPTAGTGGEITAGTEHAAGYTLHTFSSTGQSSLDFSAIDLNSRLGVVQNGVISGSGDLIFIGPGSLTLNGANTFSGLAKVNAGTLAIGSGGSIADSAGVHISPGARFNVSTVDGGYTLLSDQTLSGGGQVTGDIIIAGTHAPGFSPGLQEIQGNLTYSEGASVVWELIDNTLAGRGTSYDGIDVQGSLDYLGTKVDGHLTFDGATTLKLDFALLESAVDWSHSLWGSDITGTNGWKIFNATGDITGLENLQIENSNWLDANGVALSTARAGASFSLFQQGQGIYLNYSAVPEPSAALLGGLGMLALLRRRR
ncbi:MAG: hypothetical protein RLZZ245_1380 [Verrucomicrobiota bacterium]